jgi:class 3 adenylate cyclase/tetratricopeptide (TPR) repeat protein
MEARLPRRLAAVLYADVAGYSRLTTLDEDWTHRQLTGCLDVIAEQIRAFRGRVGHYAGDAVLADFASVTDALACAMHVQQMLRERSAHLPPERRLQFRIGINLGDVIDDRDEVYGDGVNVAARLERLAVPGGICVSDAVYAAIGSRLPVDFEDLGERELDGMAQPVRAWQVQATTPRGGDNTSCLLRAEARAHCVLMGSGERATRTALDRARLSVTGAVERHGGVVLDVPGEAILAEFDDAKAGLACAEALRTTVEDANSTLPAPDRVHYLLGIDLGTRSDTIARTAALCTSAAPGEIRLTEAVRRRLEEMDGPSQPPSGGDAYVLPAVSAGEDAAAKLPPQMRSIDLPLPDIPSIVLLPFRPVGNHPQGDALAEGLRLDVQNALVKMSGLFLIAAGTANAFRGADAVDSARALGVRHALEGSVRRSGDRARVNVQLTDAQRGVVSWTEQFDRRVDDEFVLQDEITERVITALDVKLASGEQARVWRKCLADAGARDAFYRGLQLFFRMNAQSVAEAKSHFERVADLAPDSSMGPTWMAMCLWFEATRGWASDVGRARAEAGTWAEKGTGLEDLDGQAHTVLGNVRLLQRRHDEAMRIAREAVAIRPGCTNANGFLANVLLHCGQPESALTHIKQAIRLSPVYPPWFLEILAACYRESGQIGLAAAAANEVLRLNPESVQGRVILASAMVRAGASAEARRVGAEILALDDGFRTSRFGELQVYRDRRVVERLVADLREAGLPA